MFLLADQLLQSLVLHILSNHLISDFVEFLLLVYILFLDLLLDLGKLLQLEVFIGECLHLRLDILVLQLSLLADVLDVVFLLLDLLHHQRIESVAGCPVVQFVDGFPKRVVLMLLSLVSKVDCLFPSVAPHDCIVVVFVLLEQTVFIDFVLLEQTIFIDFVLLEQTVFTYLLLHHVETSPLLVEFVFEEVSE